jgi:hypothetical protein
MGGTGSSNWYRWDTKGTVEDCHALDVRRWQRDGLLSPGLAFTWKWSRNGQKFAGIAVRVQTGHVVLNYRHRRDGGEWESLDYAVTLDTTGCHYGGARHWFLCPAVGCGRRVALLYLGGRYFACRNCYQLAYTSQREAQLDRLARRADKLRERLQWEPGILNGWGERPRGMHRRTFERLASEADELTDQFLAETAKRPLWLVKSPR